MMRKTKDSFSVKIYLAGDIDVIKQACRQFCLERPTCVTVSETSFIYNGGEELGVVIGLVNYPRFDDNDPDLIMDKAIDLANRCRSAACQWSWLIDTPFETIWDTLKE